jgi:hypothetical protein
MAQHLANRGLCPRGTITAPEENWHDEGSWGDGGTWDPSEINGVIEHQRNQQSYADSAFVSTTPSFDRATSYALHSAEKGVVYELDVALLEPNGVRYFRVNDVVKLDVTVPDDDEYALIADPPGPLPEAIVIRTITVSKEAGHANAPTRSAS